MRRIPVRILFLDPIRRRIPVRIHIQPLPGVLLSYILVSCTLNSILVLYRSWALLRLVLFYLQLACKSPPNSLNYSICTD